jgi:6-phosphogluconolactonase
MIDFLLHKDAEMVAEAVANFFCESSFMASGTKDYVDIFLTGGSTPEKLYKKLVAMPIDWTKIRLFIGDDRFVEVTDPASNWGMIKRTLLDHIDIPKANLFPMPTPSSGLSLEEAAEAYAKVVPNKPDLILLGMGEDGHTASLFPGKPALKVQGKKVVSSSPGALPPHVDRITLTFEAINSAKHVWVLVTGEKKREKLSAWRDRVGSVETLPVLGLDPLVGLVFFDNAAAGE